MTCDLPEYAPLGQVREWLRARVDDGEFCPVCTQFSKVYRRKLTSEAARVLLQMYRVDPRGWVHVPSLGAQGGDTLKARYWNLIEPDDNIRDDGSKRTGWWRLTGTGRAFLTGGTKIPKYARIYNNRCLGFEGDETVTLEDALGASFDYASLMNA